jgi:Na+-driven multidrug efflux pump
MGFAYMRRSGFYRRLAIRRAWPRWAAQREILGLGVPMSLSYALEATSFTAITLLAARLGTTVMGDRARRVDAAWRPHSSVLARSRHSSRRR